MCLAILVGIAYQVVWIVQIVYVANEDYGPANGCGYIH